MEEDDTSRGEPGACKAIVREQQSYRDDRPVGGEERVSKGKKPKSVSR